MPCESNVLEEQKTASKDVQLTPVLRKALKIASYEAMSPRHLLSRIRYLGIGFVASGLMIAIGLAFIVFRLADSEELRILSVLFIVFGAIFLCATVVASITILLRAYLSQYAASRFAADNSREACSEMYELMEKLDQLPDDYSFKRELVQKVQRTVNTQENETEIARELVGLVKSRLSERRVA